MEHIHLQSLSIGEFKNIIKESLVQLVQRVKPPAESDEKLTRSETATFLRCSLTTIDKLSRDGQLQKYKLGGKVYFKKSEIETSLQEIKNLKYKRN